MPTIRERIRRGVPQEAERLGVGAGGVAHTDGGPELRLQGGVAYVAVHQLDRRLSSCLPVCGPLLLTSASRSKWAVAASCFKTNFFPAQLLSGDAAISAFRVGELRE
jgi:hypothetical protein